MSTKTYQFVISSLPAGRQAKREISSNRVMRSLVPSFDGTRDDTKKSLPASP